MEDPTPRPAPAEPAGRRLDSWKAIAAHFGRDVTTVRRWERREGLPVHRLFHSKLGSVYAYTHELDDWWSARRPEKAPTPHPSLEALEQDADDSAPPPVPTPQRRDLRRLAVWAGSGLGLMSALAVTPLPHQLSEWLGPRGERTADARAADPLIRGIAVLPLTDLAADSRGTAFVDGMTAGLVSGLARSDSLKVIGPASVMRYRTAGRPSLTRVARDLDVDAVLEGSLVKVDDRVRLNVTLVHAATRHQLWGGSYDRPLQDVLALQSDIARAVASHVDRRAAPLERRLAARVRPDAYEAYVEGRAHAQHVTPAGLARAVASFEQAIARDPDFALAHAALAAALIDQGIHGGGEAVHRIAEVRQAVVRALALDPGLAEAHTIAGMVRCWYDWDWSGAEASFRRAIELEPSLVSAHLEYSVLLQTLGRLDEAIASAARAVLLDPQSPLALAGEGRAMYRARRYADAEARYQRALAIDPESGVALDRLAQLYLAKRRAGEARETLDRLERLPSHRPLGALHARLAALSNDAASARRLLAKLPASTGPQAIAAIHVELGDHDRALAVLDRGVAERTFVPVAWSNPELDPLRSRPQFAGLVRRMGLPADRLVALGRAPALAARPGCAP